MVPFQALPESKAQRETTTARLSTSSASTCRSAPYGAIRATYSNSVLSLRVPRPKRSSPSEIKVAGQVVSTRTGGEATVERHGRFPPPGECSTLAHNF